MDRLFGTDGIRGVANEYPMTPEMVLKIGRAVAAYLGTANNSAIVIGKDTRISGSMLESGLISGICSMGGDAMLAGIMPTPGVAFLTASLPASAGLVVSASHNPYYDNGVKIFGSDGYKLSDEIEQEIESYIMDDALAEKAGKIRETGKVQIVTAAKKHYKLFLKRSLPTGVNFNRLKIAIDCSNGATCNVAPELFAELGTDLEAFFTEPDGMNINANCGSQHPDVLADKVIGIGANIGLAFDGDGDRLIAVDEKGDVLTGDQIIAICAKHMQQKGALKNNVVVSTVMSNMGLGVALSKMGILHVTTRVGDRYVMEEMLAHGAVLGGEDSGHTVFLEHQTTGDGMLTALKLIEVMLSENKPLSELKSVMPVFPQVLINVEVKSKPQLETLQEIKDAIHNVEEKLKGQGRVLVRYSGTQPQCRVMVEGPTEGETRRYCRQIADIVAEKIGA
jgi:phosphoglucosamine mutase